MKRLFKNARIGSPFTAVTQITILTDRKSMSSWSKSIKGTINDAFILRDLHKSRHSFYSTDAVKFRHRRPQMCAYNWVPKVNPGRHPSFMYRKPRWESMYTGGKIVVKSTNKHWFQVHALNMNVQFGPIKSPIEDLRSTGDLRLIATDRQWIQEPRQAPYKFYHTR